MDINTPVGEFVVVTNESIKNGQPCDQLQISELEIGKPYKLVTKNVGSWYTDIWIEDNKMAFNSVMFENYTMTDSKKIQELEIALLVYANPDNWTEPFQRQGKTYRQSQKELNNDGGTIARNALALTRGKFNGAL